MTDLHPSDNARGHVTGIGVATSVEHVASILSIVHGYEIGDWLRFQCDRPSPQ